MPIRRTEELQFPYFNVCVAETEALIHIFACFSKYSTQFIIVRASELWEIITHKKTEHLLFHL